MGLRASLDVMEKREKPFPYQESNPDFSTVQLVSLCVCFSLRSLCKVGSLQYGQFESEYGSMTYSGLAEVVDNAREFMSLLRKVEQTALGSHVLS
jgi:hypothetical protein